MRRKSRRKRCSPHFTVCCSSGHWGNQNGTFLLAMWLPARGPAESRHRLRWCGQYRLCWPGGARSVGSQGCCASGSSATSCPLSIAYTLSSRIGVQCKESPCLHLKSLWGAVGQVLLSCHVSDGVVTGGRLAVPSLGSQREQAGAKWGAAVREESMSCTMLGHLGIAWTCCMCFRAFLWEWGTYKPFTIGISFLCRNYLKTACSFVMLVYCVGFKIACWGTPRCGCFVGGCGREEPNSHQV